MVMVYSSSSSSGGSSSSSNIFNPKGTYNVSTRTYTDPSGNKMSMNLSNALKSGATIVSSGGRSKGNVGGGGSGGSRYDSSTKTYTDKSGNKYSMASPPIETQPSPKPSPKTISPAPPLPEQAVSIGTYAQKPPQRYDVEVFKQAGRETFFAPRYGEGKYGVISGAGTLISPLFKPPRTGDVKFTEPGYGTIQDNSVSIPGTGAGKTTTSFDRTRTEALSDLKALIPLEARYFKETENISEELGSKYQGEVDSGKMSVDEATEKYEAEYEKEVGKIDMKQFQGSERLRKSVSFGESPTFNPKRTSELVGIGALSLTPTGQAMIGTSFVAGGIPKIGKGSLGSDLTTGERAKLIGLGGAEVSLGLVGGGLGIRSAERQADKLLIQEIISEEGTISGKELLRADTGSLFKTTSTKSLGTEAKITTELTTPVFKTIRQPIIERTEFGQEVIIEPGGDLYSITGGRGITKSKIWSIEKGKFIEGESTFSFQAPNIKTSPTVREVFGKDRITKEGFEGGGGNLFLTKETSKTFTTTPGKPSVEFNIRGMRENFKSALGTKSTPEVRNIIKETSKVSPETFKIGEFGGSFKRYNTEFGNIVGVKGGDITSSVYPRKRMGQFIFEKQPLTKVKVKERGFINLLESPGESGVQFLSPTKIKKTPLSKTFEQTQTTKQTFKPTTKFTSPKVTPGGISPKVEPKIIQTPKIFSPSTIYPSASIGLINDIPVNMGNIGSSNIGKLRGGTINANQVGESTLDLSNIRLSSTQGLSFRSNEKQRDKILLRAPSKLTSSSRTQQSEKVVQSLKSKQAQGIKMKSTSLILPPSIKPPSPTPIVPKPGFGFTPSFRLPSIKKSKILSKRKGRSKIRRSIKRSPSLFAIGRGIKSTKKGFIESSGITIRPILKKSKKKKKKVKGGKK